MNLEVSLSIVHKDDYGTFNGLFDGFNEVMLKFPGNAMEFIGILSNLDKQAAHDSGNEALAVWQEDFRVVQEKFQAFDFEASFVEDLGFMNFYALESYVKRNVVPASAEMMPDLVEFSTEQAAQLLFTARGIYERWSKSGQTDLALELMPVEMNSLGATNLFDEKYFADILGLVNFLDENIEFWRSPDYVLLYRTLE